MKQPVVIAIVGATASGKTSVALELSRLLDSEIISADSRQLYQYLDIGTAKPSREELNSCKHHFIDIIPPNEPYSAGTFADSALPIVLSLLEQDRLPIVVGGSGLYVRALCEGIFNEAADSNSLHWRHLLDERIKLEGKERMYQELQEVDSISAVKYADMNPRRIVRALEYYYSTGIPFSQAHIENTPPQVPFRTLYFGIEHTREALYARINQRCIDMWENGLIEETERVLKMGYSPMLNALNTVGYKEVLKYLSGELTAKDALSAMQQSTRNYAKRQLTWFRKIEGMEWLSGSSKEIAENIATQFTRLRLTDN